MNPTIDFRQADIGPTSIVDFYYGPCLAKLHQIAPAQNTPQPASQAAASLRDGLVGLCLSFWLVGQRGPASEFLDGCA
jgi:hypothetical protein